MVLLTERAILDSVRLLNFFVSCLIIFFNFFFFPVFSVFPHYVRCSSDMSKPYFYPCNIPQEPTKAKDSEKRMICYIFQSAEKHEILTVDVEVSVTVDVTMQ